MIARRIRVCSVTTTPRPTASATFNVNYQTVVLPVFYGCETWSLAVMEENRLRVFENRVLGKILVNKREKETGLWTRLHNEKFHDLLFVNRYH